MAVSLNTALGAYPITALAGTTYVPLAGNATMTGALTLPAGSAAAPSLNVAVNTGLYRYGASNLGVAVDGVEVAALSGSAFYLLQTGAAIQITSTGSYGFSSGATPGTSDVLLYRDAAATLAQRNGTTQQIFRLYSTYTDSSNFERLTLTGVAGTSVNITAETLGTGGDNIDLVLTPAGTGANRLVGPVVAGVNGLESVGLAYGGEYGARVFSSAFFGWTGGSITAGIDAALMRNAAGIVEVNNGTAGTYRDLKLRNLLSTGYATIDSGTLTASAPALNITQTWTTGATFTASLINITDTSSNSNSLLQDWQIGGSTVARVRKDGTLFLSGGLSSGGSGFFSTIVLGGAADLYLYRDAAATLAQRNGTTQQIFRLYNTYTDSSNYERLTLTGVAGTSVNITAETLGTGADNLDIVLTPAGTGKFKFPSGSIDQFGNVVASSFYHSGSAMAFYSPGVRTRDTGEIAWSSTTTVAGTVDVAMHRASAGVIAIDNGTAGTYRDLLVRNVKTDPVAFASLVAAATAGNGARAMITNCSHATFGTAADGGGSTKVPVYSDGTSWLVG